MAVVYQAQHAELGSLHAIKRLKIPSAKFKSDWFKKASVVSFGPQCTERD